MMLKPGSHLRKAAPSPFRRWSQHPIECWHFKLVSADGSERYLVSPCLYKNSGSPVDSHASVRIVDGRNGYTTVHRYPPEELYRSTKEFYIRVGRNSFAEDFIELYIDTPGRRVQGELRLSEHVRWMDGYLRREPRWGGLLGQNLPYNWFCYSLDHSVRGRLEVDGRLVDFSGGRGYLEKEWGTALPDASLLLQTNHFESAGAGLAVIVVRTSHAAGGYGLAAGFTYRGTVYSFMRSPRSYVEYARLTDTQLQLHIRGMASHRTPEGMPGFAAHRLEINAYRTGANDRAPLSASPLRAFGSLDATANVRLSGIEKGGHERLLFAESGRWAILEVAGSPAVLLEALGNGTPVY